MATLDLLRADRIDDPSAWVYASDHNDVVRAILERPVKDADVASANLLGAPGIGNVAGTYANGTAGVGATLTTAAATLTTDGISITNGMRVLLKDQSTTAQNGLYVASGVGTAVVLTRAPEANTPESASDMIVSVAQGTVNGDTQWRCTATAPTIGTTALLFRRYTPFYGHGNPRNPWDIGGDTTQPIMATMPRSQAYTTVTLPTAATHWLYGGIVIPAGRTVTNVFYRYTTAAATITVDYVSLIRLSDRTVLATSGNNTGAWAAAPANRSRTLSTPYTPSYDTPVYVGLAFASTTAPVLVGGPAFSSANVVNAAPVLLGTTTTPTATPITGTANALTAGTLGMVYIWLA